MLERRLLREIEKWTEKLDDRVSELEANNNRGEEILENVRAYRKDSEYFMGEDLIKSYECLIWAWAFTEIGENFEFLSEKEE